MIASVDGRIDCDMTEQIEGGNEYYEALEALDCPSMLMGRVTMQMHYALPEPFVAEDSTPIGTEAFHVVRKAQGYLTRTVHCSGARTSSTVRLCLLLLMSSVLAVIMNA